MNELTTTRTLDVVAAEIRTFTASMLNNIIEIGRRMCEAKQMLQHGEFGDWVKENTGYSKSTANNFMRLFQEYGSDQGCLFGAEISNVQTFGNLSYTKALALIQVPAEEREEFVETHDVEGMTTRELEQAIRERDEARQALDDAKEQVRSEMEAVNAAEIEKYRKKLDKAEKKASAAENKAQNLQIQVNKAGEEAQAKAREEVKKELEEATTAAKSAEAAKADAEARAADLERRLKLADGDAAVFQVYFQQVQDDCNRMIGIILKSQPEQAEKYKKAVTALLDSIRGSL